MTVESQRQLNSTEIQTFLKPSIQNWAPHIIHHEPSSWNWLGKPHSMSVKYSEWEWTITWPAYILSISKSFTSKYPYLPVESVSAPLKLRRRNEIYEKVRKMLKKRLILKHLKNMPNTHRWLCIVYKQMLSSKNNFGKNINVCGL